tara:strand:- start:15540 stop:16385 length:846 start_codon:yes stop_codon:yes gene_type:complete
MIDPNFWSDDKVIELEPVQRLLFIGMWNFADDSGVLKYSSKQLKAQIFPADDVTHETINEWLMNLRKLGLVLFNKDSSLIRIKGWKIYQKINRPQPSKYEFVDVLIEDSLNNQGAITPNRIEKKLTEDSIIEDSIIPQKKVVVKQVDQNLEDFERFYTLYPRKVSKQATIKAFKRLKKKEISLVMDTLPNHIKMWVDKGTEMEFIPHPSTWLNQRKWEDVLDSDMPNLQQQKNDEIRKREEEAQKKYFAEMKEAQKTAATPEEIRSIISGVNNKLSMGGKN